MSPRSLLALLLLVLIAASSLSAAPESGGSTAPSPLRFEGRLTVATPGKGASGSQVEPLVLRLLPEGFVLVDFPDRSIYGFPVFPAKVDKGRLSFSIGSGEGALRLDGRLSGSERAPTRLEGSLTQGKVAGSFLLAPAPRAREYGEQVSIQVRGGALRGSLIVPATASPPPLVVLVSGPGSTDRDGNNYQVPGRSDALLSLAEALAKTGVASLRYDKRGTGESLALAPEESKLRFDDYIADLRALLALFGKDKRFSGLLVAGHAEGALVAAAALADGGGRAGTPPGSLPLALLAADGQSALETFTKAIEGAPPGEVAEGRAILKRLLEGGTWPKPSPFYADFFRPSFQAYLSSWLRLDLREILPRLSGPLLLVQGNNDLQVDIASFLALAKLRPSDPAVVIQGMNHVLKEVPGEVDANLASFSDPTVPASADLVATLAAFAKGQDLPGFALRVDGGRLPETGP